MHTDSTPPSNPETDPRLRELFERLEQLDPGPLALETDQRDDAEWIPTAWTAFKARVVDRTTEPTYTAAYNAGRARPRGMVGRSWAMTVMAVTACLLVILGIGTWVRTRASNAETPQTFATKLGQQMTVRLSDGSTIRLAPATSVTVSMPTVEVTGAAYFTIAPQADRSLTIRTRNAVVQVLGTRFEVRQYANEPVSRIVVEDGRVALRSLREGKSDQNTRTVASARMMAQVSDSGVTLTSGITTRAFTGWVRDTLVFERVPLREVVTEVGRAYGAQIRVADSVLASARVNAEVVVTQFSLPQVLSMIGEAMSAHYVEEQGAFVLMPGRGASVERFERTPNHGIPQPERQYGR